MQPGNFEIASLAICTVLILLGLYYFTFSGLILSLVIRNITYSTSTAVIVIEKVTVEVFYVRGKIGVIPQH